jgi:hypothetical protein
MKGTTLIELMLALFISTLILSSIIGIYVATQSVQQMQIALTTLVENSHLAFSFLTSDIKKENKIQPYFNSEIKKGSMAFTVRHEIKNEINTYFIGKTKRNDARGNFIYALYQLDNQHRKLELVEGINDMKIQYTLLENNKMIERSAEEINNKSKIIGLSIMLTLTSLNTVPLQKNEYMYVSL